MTATVPYSDDEITMTRAAFERLPEGFKSVLPDGTLWVLRHSDRYGTEFQPVELVEPCEHCGTYNCPPGCPAFADLQR